ncbi:MAG: hypothetical protein K9G24_00230 [Candidatus Nanopelagicales bacterium]|jgi:hypothetical protein|nr:hypothetical protein [Candidatus Nanopelagicales bacterium]MCF8536328.1 hypothetical protein [Candidatus Nanopelagicales bacterium]MCF8541483.1 hypothetical protein [Candidatus Nanopelagicales bacterium]MCF8556309.1 hypothetical protein [Candidatus Nanopelagicales bacterium]
MRTERRALAVLVAGFIVGLVSGAALGVVWAALAPRVPVIIRQDVSIPQGFQPEEYLASDIAFGVLGLIAGVLVTIGLAYMRREHLLSVLLGSLLAGTVGTAAMWFVGTRLGSVDIAGLQATLTDEVVVDGPLEVHLSGMFLMWVVASAAVVTLLALSDWIGDLRSRARSERTSPSS